MKNKKQKILSFLLLAILIVSSLVAIYNFNELMKSNYVNQIVSEIRADKQLILMTYFENLSLEIEFQNIIFLNFSLEDVFDYYLIENWTVSIDIEETKIFGYLRFNGTILRYSYGVCYVLFKDTYVSFIISIIYYIDKSLIYFYILYETKLIAEVYNVHKYFLKNPISKVLKIFSSHLFLILLAVIVICVIKKRRLSNEKNSCFP